MEIINETNKENFNFQNLPKNRSADGNLLIQQNQMQNQQQQSEIYYLNEKLKEFDKIKLENKQIKEKYNELLQYNQKQQDQQLSQNIQLQNEFQKNEIQLLKLEIENQKQKISQMEQQKEDIQTEKIVLENQNIELLETVKHLKEEISQIELQKEIDKKQNSRSNSKQDLSNRKGIFITQIVLKILMQQEESKRELLQQEKDRLHNVNDEQKQQLEMINTELNFSKQQCEQLQNDLNNALILKQCTIHKEILGKMTPGQKVYMKQIEYLCKQIQGLENQINIEYQRGSFISQRGNSEINLRKNLFIDYLDEEDNIKEQYDQKAIQNQDEINNQQNNQCEQLQQKIQSQQNQQLTPDKKSQSKKDKKSKKKEKDSIKKSKKKSKKNDGCLIF
ncbi:hypothetical protein PPERSA_02895 [Pseudocohnilembus persalinus]|uniref:Uncharacterized protein n=1 Tax=Pseudocohnilembus persalinus TaxID=266149 RepID=A0A0V0QN05_PSEPJ|nr:hypothetical protein PPERSA_02895 [Pseudocohnilembus persalinus]|eukprot:KRX03516.1 hypothetical protein PPERSA_02895 [Pseudocohnilembus persalinus]